MKLKNKIIGILLLLFLTYVTILTRLHSLTGRYDWTLINSPALKELIIITVIFIVGAFIVHRVRKK